MTSTKQRLRFPASALDWLLAQSHDLGRALDVLALGVSASQVNELLGRGHRVWMIGEDVAKLSRLANHGAAPGAAQDHRQSLLVTAGSAAALPMHDCQVDVVLWLAGEPQSTRVTAELARVLRPGGWVSGARIVRDDTVPWVRRFIDLMNAIDPAAMQAVGPDVTFETFTSSNKFPAPERRGFRIWTEITKHELVAMATRSVSTSGPGTPNLEALAARVGALYDDAAGPSGLRLPYQLQCWRAVVDHSELTAPIQRPDDGLRISI